MSIERHPINQCHFGLTVWTLKAERDALLEAAKEALRIGELGLSFNNQRGMMSRLRAALSRAEGGKP